MRRYIAYRCKACGHVFTRAIRLFASDREVDRELRCDAMHVCPDNGWSHGEAFAITNVSVRTNQEEVQV